MALDLDLKFDTLTRGVYFSKRAMKKATGRTGYVDELPELPELKSYYDAPFPAQSTIADEKRKAERNGDYKPQNADEYYPITAMLPLTPLLNTGNMKSQLRNPSQPLWHTAPFSATLAGAVDGTRPRWDMVPDAFYAYRIKHYDGTYTGYGPKKTRKNQGDGLKQTEFTDDDFVNYAEVDEVKNFVDSVPIEAFKPTLSSSVQKTADKKAQRQACEYRNFRRDRRVYMKRHYTDTKRYCHITYDPSDRSKKEKDNLRKRERNLKMQYLDNTDDDCETKFGNDYNESEYHAFHQQSSAYSSKKAGKKGKASLSDSSKNGNIVEADCDSKMDDDYANNNAAEHVDASLEDALSKCDSLDSKSSNNSSNNRQLKIVFRKRQGEMRRDNMSHFRRKEKKGDKFLANFPPSKRLDDKLQKRRDQRTKTLKFNRARLDKDSRRNFESVTFGGDDFDLCGQSQNCTNNTVFSGSTIRDSWGNLDNIQVEYPEDLWELLDKSDVPAGADGPADVSDNSVDSKAVVESTNADASKGSGKKTFKNRLESFSNSLRSLFGF